MGIFKNPFNSDKKYYLELDEAKDSKAVKAATEVANTVKEKAEAVVETAQEEVTSIVTEEKPEQAKPVAAKAKAKKSTAKSKKKGKTATSTTTTQSTKTTVKKSGASSYEPPFWVAAMYNSNGSAASNGGASSNGAATDSETFATSNLMPTVTNYRRRPGGSLNKFKDMAKTVRTSRR